MTGEGHVDDLQFHVAKRVTPSHWPDQCRFRAQEFDYRLIRSPIESSIATLGSEMTEKFHHREQAMADTRRDGSQGVFRCD
jgi:hypothetical protein